MMESLRLDIATSLTSSLTQHLLKSKPGPPARTVALAAPWAQHCPGLLQLKPPGHLPSHSPSTSLIPTPPRIFASSLTSPGKDHSVQGGCQLFLKHRAALASPEHRPIWSSQLCWSPGAKAHSGASHSPGALAFLPRVLRAIIIKRSPWMSAVWDRVCCLPWHGSW